MFRWVPALVAVFALIHAIPAAAAYDVTISNAPSSNVSFTAGLYVASGNDAVINAADLEGALLTNDVVVNTGSAGTQTGNIAVAAPIASVDSHSITFSPAASILLGADVSLPNASQTYAGPVDLTADVALAGDSISFTNTVDGGHGLTASATSTAFDGQVGASTALSSLAIAGSANLSASSITTTGAQVYNGATHLAADTALTSTSGGVDFESTLDGASALTINANSSSFGGAVGGTTPLTTLTDNAPVTLGGLVATTGNQVFNGPATLASDATLSASLLALESTVDGAHTLSLQGSGIAAIIASDVGATTRLTGLTSSVPVLLGGSVHTSGDQSWTNIFLGSNSMLDSAGGSINVAGTVSISTYSLVIGGGGSVDGVISGTGDVTKVGTGTLTLNAVETYTGSTNVLGGTLAVNGTIGDVTLNGATLALNGTVGRVALNDATLTGKGTTYSIYAVVGGGGGTVSPGSAGPALLTTQGVLLDTASTYSVDLDGDLPGVGYDQVGAGVVSLNAATLRVTAGYTPAPGQVFRIVDNLGSDPVTSTFAGLPEGSTIDAGALRFQISYVGGDGNDVTLTRVPQPTALLLTATPTSSILGDLVTVKAIVTGAGGAAVPSGTVAFRDGQATLGTAAVVAGVAQLTTSALAAGDHALSADFSGTGFDPSTGSTTAHVDPKPSDQGSGGTSGDQQTQITPPTQQQGPTVTPPATVTTTVRIAAADARARAKKHRRSTVTFLVRLSRAAATRVTVRFATRNGSAKARRDYKARTGKLIFKPGTTTMRVKVVLLPRKGRAGKRKLTLVLSKPTGASLRRSHAVGTIS